MIAGKNNYAEVTVEVSLSGLEIEPQLEIIPTEALLPKACRNAIQEGLRGGFLSGPLGGYQMIHVKAVVTSVKSRENELSELACTAAAEAALREAVNKAGAMLYEPLMALEVTTPDEFMGNIIHDLNGRRAEISEISQHGILRLVKAKVALAEMFGYATAVRGLSTGRANYSMEPCAYAPVPKNRIKEILGYDPEA